MASHKNTYCGQVGNLLLYVLLFHLCTAFIAVSSSGLKPEPLTVVKPRCRIDDAEQRPPVVQLPDDKVSRTRSRKKIQFSTSVGRPKLRPTFGRTNCHITYLSSLGPIRSKAALTSSNDKFDAHCKSYYRARNFKLHTYRPPRSSAAASQSFLRRDVYSISHVLTPPSTMPKPLFSLNASETWHNHFKGRSLSTRLTEREVDGLGRPTLAISTGENRKRGNIRRLSQDSQVRSVGGHINVEHKRSKSPQRGNGPLTTVTVAQDGSGDFYTVQQAVDSVPASNTQRVIIRIHAGIYREKVVVPYNKPFITFHGDEYNSTIITWNATASTAFAKYSRINGSLLGTMGSASVTILSDEFVAQHITFENSAPAPQPGAVGAQAVAFLIVGDRAAFYYCSFFGAQDTLYDYTGRHYYLSCYIQGSIDFVFGNGRSLFEECVLHSIATSFGAIAAHQRLSPDDDTGFSFHRCAVTGSGMLYLGRAWSPYARIVFARTYFDNIIFAEGWSDFGDPRRQRTTFFGQYQCYGPGANESHRAPWSKELTDDDVLPYLSLDFVNGREWLGGPFTP